MKILVLDDEPEEICPPQYREQYALDMGMQIVFAANPQEAEKYLSQDSFDLLFLDGFLIFGQPDEKTVYGPEVLASWIERGIALPPVYMISTNEDMCAKGIALGAKGKISKQILSWIHSPHTLAENILLLERLLEH